MWYKKHNRESAGQNMGTPGKVKKAAGWLSVLAGSALGFYIGICRILVPSLFGLLLACKEGRLTITYIIFTFAKCWLALTISGLIWTIGYMIKCILDVG